MPSLKGNLTVKSVITAGRRCNQGAADRSITGADVIVVNDEAWLNYTSDGAYNITLPDANTLPLGWTVVINNKSAFTLTVKDGAAGTVKAISAVRAYRFTATNIDDAEGEWFVDYLEEADLLPAERYSSSFNATTDWGVAVAGYYTISITAATHGMGTQPLVIVGELNGSDFDGVILDNMKILANGDIAMRVVELPDSRFAGRITIL
jgi:hypothetical protein